MQDIRTLANKASTDLSAKAGYLVKFDTTGQNVCSAITDAPTGVVTRGGETESDVCMLGECHAIAGGAVTRGQRITSHTDGTVINTAGASCQDCGFAMESGVAGDWVRIFFIPPMKTHA